MREQQRRATLAKRGLITRGRRAGTLAVVAATVSLSLGVGAAQATTWYVQAGAHAGGNGTARSPFSSLATVEAASAPGDKIVIKRARTSVKPLDGGLQLKPKQQLIGAGKAVAGQTAGASTLPALENTSGEHLEGDAVRLASDATVRNVVVEGAYRGDIYGLDSVGVRLTDNDISGQNTSCTKGFLVQPFNVPTGVPLVDVPASPAIAPQNGWAGIMVDGSGATGSVTIEKNYVHEGVCGDGIDIRATGSSALTGTVNGNTVTHLPQGTGEGISSVLAIGMQALESGLLTVHQDANTETYIGSAGADCEGEFVNTAGSGDVVDEVDHNTFAHGIGGTSCNGFETIISTGSGEIDVNLQNSTFTDNNGDAFEEGNLGSGSTMRFVAQNVTVNGTTVRGENPPLSSDEGHNVIPFNIGDCMVLGGTGAGDSTTFVANNSVFEGCNNGISAGNNDGTGNGVGPSESLVVQINHSVITDNDKYGLHVATATPINHLHVSVGASAITGNGEPGASVQYEPQALALDSQIDFGSGSAGSPGENCLSGNGRDDVEAMNVAITADNDWWGHPGPPGSGQLATSGTGSIAVDGGLSSEPQCGTR